MNRSTSENLTTLTTMVFSLRLNLALIAVAIVFMAMFVAPTEAFNKTAVVDKIKEFVKELLTDLFKDGLGGDSKGSGSS